MTKEVVTHLICLSLNLHRIEKRRSIHKINEGYLVIEYTKNMIDYFFIFSTNKPSR